jgi:glycosyltransferase involved in cell wall biosynthesis
MGPGTDLLDGRRPRVLFLTGHLPYPPVSGGRRREYELLRLLSTEFEVHLHAVSKTPEEDAANAGRLREHCASVHVAAATQATSSLDPAVPPLVQRHVCPEMTERVGTAVSEGSVDLVHVEGFYLMPHVPLGRVPTLLVEQNIEYNVCRQRVRTARNRFERRLRLVEYGATLQAEIEAWRRSTLLATVSEEDRDTIRAALPGLDVRLVPDGADHLSAARTAGQVGAALPAAKPGGDSLLFVGNFGYAPNVDAALYLCSEILPRIRRRVPDVDLALVGNSPPPEIERLASENVVVTGRVPSVEPYLDAASVVVVPLREGGGVKVKVLEAVSRGKAVVTTSIGAQGLGSDAGAFLEIHDPPAEFARAVSELLRDPPRRHALEDAALSYASSAPTWKDAAGALRECYLDLLGSRAPDTRSREPIPRA